MSPSEKHQRHWSFIVCDKKYIYPLTLIVLLVGLLVAIRSHDPIHFSRVGNLVVGMGVWISMRSTLREGFKQGTNLADLSPTIPGTNALNSDFFNRLTYVAGDLRLQVHGFVLVLIGSVVGSYGDLILKGLNPSFWAPLH